jgi:hypothetical protein
MSMQLVRFEKTGGPLTKRIYLDAAGSVISDGSACSMVRGTAQRLPIMDAGDLGDALAKMRSNQAIGLGALVSALPERCEVVTKSNLRKRDGENRRDLIARTRDYIHFSPERPAFMLLDHDSKGMPDAVKERLDAFGGFWPALISVVPELSKIARVTRASTSAGLFHSESGEKFPGSGGQHDYVQAIDGADIDRFLADLHDHCWLHGLGWKMVGAGGQLLERSIIDRMVGLPERLCFEGAPIIEPPLWQDAEIRQPAVYDGAALNTLQACQPLTAGERSKLRELKAKEDQRLAGDAAAARSKFIRKQARRLIEAGMSEFRARSIIEQQCRGILLPNVVLSFDDDELLGKTVADVLADPFAFEGETLADPLEGPEYGTGKAKIMLRPDSQVWINSFAHGRTVYELKFDAGAVRSAITKAPKADAILVFLNWLRRSHLAPDDIADLKKHTAECSGVGVQAVNQAYKEARAEQRAERLKEEEQRRLANRHDPRPQLPVPENDDPWLPVMDAANDVLGASDMLEPPMRNIDGENNRKHTRTVPGMHSFVSDEANDEADETTRLPPPKQLLLSVMSTEEVAEMIERHIDFVDVEGRSVHLPTTFVRHFMKRHDDVLPTITAIATLPIVLPNGKILAKSRGIDRDRGLIFHIDDELMNLLPKRESCDDDAVAKAMRFLTDEWLYDVATNYVGKSILIAGALTVIERTLLADRPVFWVTAGRRGSGKTTALTMLIMAVTGLRPAAAAWSPNEEERRKALFSYFLEGVPNIIWDNIPRGTQINCPHIEKSCTAAFYSDRKLGVSESVATSAATIHLFTGNNVGPKGDLASRSLRVLLEIERADPENRDFKHTDPIGWTEAHRAEILGALYTILLGNPILRKPLYAPMETRFKMWWRLIGSAVEHAAKQAVERTPKHVPEGMEPEERVAWLQRQPVKLAFRSIFLEQEEEEEESVDLAEALKILHAKFTGDFAATSVAAFINDPEGRDPAATLRTFLYGERMAAETKVTGKSVGKRLKPHVNSTVKVGNTLLTLKAQEGHDRVAFWIKELIEG